MAFRFGKQNLHASAKHALKPGFQAALRSDGVYELLVYDEIGEDWWSGGGITAKSFRQELDRAGTYSRIALRINSPGGDAFEGVAILNMLRSLGKPIDVYVDGVAASAASVIAMAGDQILMGSGAIMMVHCAWGITIGNASEHQKQVNALSAIDMAIAQTYAERTGMKLDDCKALMDAETWMGADECIQKGFATGKTAEAKPEALAMAKNFKALKKFAKTPAALQPAAEDPEEMCECECENCQAGDCADCTNAECDDPHCIGCPMQQEEAAASNPQSPTLAIAGASIHLASYLGPHSAGWLDYQFSAKHPTRAGQILALRRSGTLALARAENGKAARISGLLSPYDALSCDLGGFREKYERGCFSEWLRSGEDGAVVYAHNPEKILGRTSAETARFWEEADGLHYEVPELPDTQAGRDLEISAARGDIRGASAAFFILKYRWETDANGRIRVIEKASLLEGSPYAFPAYRTSTAAAEPAVSASADPQVELLRARLELLKTA